MGHMMFSTFFGRPNKVQLTSMCSSVLKLTIDCRFSVLLSKVQLNAVAIWTLSMRWRTYPKSGIFHLLAGEMGAI